MIKQDVYNQLIKDFGGEDNLHLKIKSITLLTTASKKAILDNTTLNAMLYLSPANEATTFSMCPHSTKGCRESCLIKSGRMIAKNSYHARILRTFKLLLYPEVFKGQLINEIAKLSERASKNNLPLVIRLNGTSDITPLDYRSIHYRRAWYIFNEVRENFANVQFVEYTKIPVIPRANNLSVTFSFSGKNLTDAKKVLDSGNNIAVVFKDELPKTFWGYDVINGDVDDNRYRDPKGVIVGLKLKGTKAAKAQAIKQGFAV